MVLHAQSELILIHQEEHLRQIANYAQLVNFAIHGDFQLLLENAIQALYASLELRCQLLSQISTLSKLQTMEDALLSTTAPRVRLLQFLVLQEPITLIPVRARAQFAQVANIVMLWLLISQQVNAARPTFASKDQLTLLSMFAIH